VGGYLTGKRAISIARTCGGKRRKFVGEHCWARGYFVSTVGRDEQGIRHYIEQQETADQGFEQVESFKNKESLLGRLLN